MKMPINNLRLKETTKITSSKDHRKLGKKSSGGSVIIFQKNEHKCQLEVKKGL